MPELTACFASHCDGDCNLLHSKHLKKRSGAQLQALRGSALTSCCNCLHCSLRSVQGRQRKLQRKNAHFAHVPAYHWKQTTNKEAAMDNRARKRMIYHNSNRNEARGAKETLKKREISAPQHGALVVGAGCQKRRARMESNRPNKVAVSL